MIRSSSNFGKMLFTVCTIRRGCISISKYNKFSDQSGRGRATEQRSCEVARPSLWSRIGSRRILDCSALFRGRTFGPPCLQGFSLLHSTPWNVGNLRILRIFGVKICPFSVAHKSVICCSISWKTLSVSSAFHSLTEKHNFIEVYWLLRSQYTSKKASFIAIRVPRFYQVASWHI